MPSRDLEKFKEAAADFDDASLLGLLELLDDGGVNDSDPATAKRAHLLSKLASAEDFSTPDPTTRVTKIVPPHPTAVPGAPEGKDGATATAKVSKTRVPRNRLQRRGRASPAKKSSRAKHKRVRFAKGTGKSAAASKRVHASKKAA